MNRRGNMIERIVAYDNLSNSFDYVLRGNRRRRNSHARYMLAHKDDVLARVKDTIVSKTFRIERYHQKVIVERNKERRIQCVSLETRILLHAVMRIVEEDLKPALILDTAASIHGRGMHWLHKRMYGDMMRDPQGTAYTYKSDYSKCYESINQDKMIEVVRHYISDEKVLYILIEAIRMLPTGVSIGLRTSQFLVNLYISHYVDQPIKRSGAKYYRRYCDDINNQRDSAYHATGDKRLLHQAAKDAELTIKGNEQFFKTSSRPVDFLGFVTYADGKIRIRKAVKQRFARKWKRVKSIKRKKELIGSFYGMAKHAHAKHLFKTITGQSMKSFSELGLVYQGREGFFPGPEVSLAELQNCTIEVIDFHRKATTKFGERTVVSIRHEGVMKKFFTNSDELINLLEQAKEREMLPFETTIGRENKFRYYFK